MNLRRAVIRLLLMTAFLLGIAWVGLKLMTYRGDWEALVRDFQPMLDKLWDFVREKVLPLMDQITAFIQEKLGG